MTREQPPLCHLLTLSVWLYISPMASSQVYTSSQKVQDMVLQEETLLNNLRTEIVKLENSSMLSFFTQFYEHRTRRIPDPMCTADIHESLKHPNAIYRTIKEFKDDYQEFRTMLGPEPPPNIQQHLYGIANDGDVFGAWRSFLRIQEVYNLNPLDMVRGDYLGVKGPPLRAQDAFEIGKLAFAEPASEEVEALRQDLESKPILQGPGSSVSDTNFTRLCSAHNKITWEKFDPRLSCSYRPTCLPYYRFKQELVSNSPYVCLIYDVITEYESQYLKEFATAKLSRSMVTALNGSEAHEIRISNQAFAWDSDSKVFARLSKRVGDITYLETLHDAEPFYSAEPFQVVNYGIGGLYSAHSDTFDQNAHKGMTETLNWCGNRLATFLIYLSDVERGGATAFPRADVAIRPVKNMALFWYNLDPAGEVDKGTLHGGCPVVVGHKWVTNKWIWTHGNTFTRRCGLRQNATQLDVEEHMRRKWA